MNNDERGTIYQQGNIMRVDNALVEDVFSRNGQIGYILISHTIPGPNGVMSSDTLRLNINESTVIVNSFGLNICLCNIIPGMRIDAIFSPAMTRSIPPQTNAFFVMTQTEVQPPSSVSTDHIVNVDIDNGFVYTGIADNIYSQTRYVVSDSTSIVNRNGNPVSIRALRPGQLVRIIHANFQTASIPPQTTAFNIQIL